MTQNPFAEKNVLGAQQILEAFDEHMEKFQWRLDDIKEQIEVKAYRQLVATLTHEIKMQKNINQGLERVLKAEGINPREHPVWYKR